MPLINFALTLFDYISTLCSYKLDLPLGCLLVKYSWSISNFFKYIGKKKKQNRKKPTRTILSPDITVGQKGFKSLEYMDHQKIT